MSDFVVFRWCGRLTAVHDHTKDLFKLARGWSDRYAAEGPACPPFDQYLDSLGIPHHTPFEVVLTDDEEVARGRENQAGF